MGELKCGKAGALAFEVGLYFLLRKCPVDIFSATLREQWAK